MAFLPALRRLSTHLVSTGVSRRSGSEPGIGPSSMRRKGARMGSSRYGRMRQPAKDGIAPLARTPRGATSSFDRAVAGAPSGSSAYPAPVPERTATMIQTGTPILIASSHRGLGQLRLGRVHELREAARVLNGHVRENFAIQLDARFLKRMNEPGIEKTVEPAGSADARDPEPPKGALAVTPVAIGVLLRAVHRLGRRAEQPALG